MQGCGNPTQKRAQPTQPTHWRAISLRQLEEVVVVIRQRCESEKWVSTRDGKTLLTPTTVTLYDLNYYVILPGTVPDGVRITGLPSCSFAEGTEVCQEGKGKGYVLETVKDSTEVQVCVTEGCFMSGRTVTIGADRDRLSCDAPRISIDRHLSYVGLLTGNAQKPAWFISHWWGERVLEFVECVRSHAGLHHLDEDTPYWVCAYANDQHDLGCDVSDDPQQTSFFRALTEKGCAGVLLVLNSSEGYAQAAVALRRVWCIYEIFLALLPREGQTMKRFEMATCSGKPQVITDGLTEAEQKDEQILPGSGWENKMYREEHFPIDVLVEGTNIQVQKAEASQAQDRQHILNAISGRPLEAQPVGEHTRYEQVNQKLRGLMAVVVWPQALRQGKVNQLKLPAALKGDSDRQALHMSFSSAGEAGDGCAGQCAMDDSQLRLLAEHLPANLSESVSLDLSHCKRIGSGGVGALADALSRYKDLAALSLDFSESSLDEHGVQALGLSLSRDSGLRSLELSFRACDLITEDSVQELMVGVGLLSNLEILALDFEFCCACVAVRSLAAIANALQRLSQSLTNLKLDFTHCSGITDAGISDLSFGLTALSNVVKMSLSFHGCKKMTTLGAGTLGSRLSLLPRIVNLHLSLEMNPSVEKAGIMSIVHGLRKIENLDQIAFVFTSPTGKSEHVDSIASLHKDLPCELWSETKAGLMLPSTAASSEQGAGRLVGRHILFLTDFKFWDTEYHEIRRFLEAEGAGVVVAAKHAPGTELIGQEAGMRCNVDYHIESMIEADEYQGFDAVFVPGGAAPHALRRNDAAQKIIAWMVQKGRVAAAICHGVKMLGAAGVLDGMRCTSYLGIKLAVESYGGLWGDHAVVVDEKTGGAIITSRTPPDLPMLGEAITVEVRKRSQAREPLVP